MSDRNEDVSRNVLLLTALHRTRVHDAPIRRGSRFISKKFWSPTICFCRIPIRTYSDRFTLVRYETLVADTLGVVSALFDRTEVPLTDQTRSFLVESQSRKVDSVWSIFRGKRWWTVGEQRWRWRLPTRSRKGWSALPWNPFSRLSAALWPFLLAK